MRPFINFVLVIFILIIEKEFNFYQSYRTKYGNV